MIFNVILFLKLFLNSIFLKNKILTTFYFFLLLFLLLALRNEGYGSDYYIYESRFNDIIKINIFNYDEIPLFILHR